MGNYNKTMIAIIDYGMGNLRSVQKAFEAAGADSRITQNAEEIKSAERIVLPGVGAMACAIGRLKELNLIEVIKEEIRRGKSFLGICLGMQLLFDESEEGGKVKGLGIIEGKVKRFKGIKVPHIGWNNLRKMGSPALFDGIPDNVFVYFCHSYYCQPNDPLLVAAQTNYGVNFASAVVRDNIWAVQFHPEKSQQLGLGIVKNFVKG